MFQSDVIRMVGYNGTAQAYMGKAYGAYQSMDAVEANTPLSTGGAFAGELTILGFGFWVLCLSFGFIHGLGSRCMLSFRVRGDSRLRALSMGRAFAGELTITVSGFGFWILGYAYGSGLKCFLSFRVALSRA